MDIYDKVVGIVDGGVDDGLPEISWAIPNLNLDFSSVENMNEINLKFKSLPLDGLFLYSFIPQELVFSDEDDFKHLGNRLYEFHLKNKQVLYIRFPEIPTSATFNIIKQDPNGKTPNSGEYLLHGGTEKKFLKSLISSIDITQREGKSLVITIDDIDDIRWQEYIVYGTDSNDLKPPSKHYTWFPNAVPEEHMVTGWLEFQQGATIINDNLPEDVIEHNGKLTIRVLKNSQPIKLIGSSIDCSKNKPQEEFDEAVFEKIIKIHDCYTTKINVRLAMSDKVRWLLSKHHDPLLMTDCYLEINGKVFPNKMKYVVESVNGESADFVVRLKKSTK